MRRRVAGVTIIELMVALAIVAIAFAALAYAQITGFRVTRSSQGAAIAKDVGMKQLELLRGLGYELYKDCPDGEPVVEGVPGCTGSRVDEEHPSFTVHWAITAAPVGVAELDPPALKGVEIHVTWEDTRYDLVGYLSCGDPGEFATTEVPCPSESLRASP